MLQGGGTVRRCCQWRNVQPTPESSQTCLRREHISKHRNREWHFVSFTSSTFSTRLWTSSVSVLPLCSWRAPLDFHNLEKGLEEGGRWPMFAWNPVNCSLAFLVTFLWTGNFRAKIRAETFHKTGYNIAEFVAQLTKGPFRGCHLLHSGLKIRLRILNQNCCTGSDPQFIQASILFLDARGKAM